MNSVQSRIGSNRGRKRPPSPEIAPPSYRGADPAEPCHHCAADREAPDTHTLPYDRPVVMIPRPASLGRGLAGHGRITTYASPLEPQFEDDMPPKCFESIPDLKDHVGQELSVSDWLTITQQKINLFADATDD